MVVGGRTALVVLLLVALVALGAGLVVVLGVVVSLLLHVLLLLLVVGPGVLVFDLIAQVVVLAVFRTVAALLVSIIVLFFAFLLTFFFVHFRAHVHRFSALRLLHGLLRMVLLLGGRFRVLPLFQVDQIVHGHYGLLAEAMLRILLLILALVLLGPHRLVRLAIAIAVPAGLILLLLHRLVFGCLHLVALVEGLVVSLMGILVVVVWLAGELHVLVDVELGSAFFRLLLQVFLGLRVVAMGTLVHLTGLFCLFVLVYA